MFRHVPRLLGNRRPQLPQLAGLMILAALAIPNPRAANGATLTWIRFGSGNFNGSGNWFPTAVPGAGDFVSFEVGFGSPYTVTFPGSDLGISDGSSKTGSGVTNYSTRFLRIRDNGVTFAGSTQAFKGQSTYTVTNADQTDANRAIIIGLLAGDNASLSLANSTSVCCGGLTNFSGVAATLGDAAGSTGTLNVGYGQFNVTGSDFTQRQLVIGNYGNGVINVMNGADVNVTGFNSTTSLGRRVGGSGVVDISGAGSTWTSANSLWVGENGAGTLTVRNGGALNTTGTGGDFSAILGVFRGSFGQATISGPGSVWTNGATLHVGNAGDGQLTITGGGVLNHTVFYRPITIDSENGSSVRVAGAGSQLNTPGTIYVGSTGRGSLAVLNGGEVNAGAVVMRGLNTGRGDILVAGPNSKLNIATGSLTVGLPEPGFLIGGSTLAIDAGGLVDVTHDIYLKNGGVIDLLGGTLAVNAIRQGEESTNDFLGFLNFAGGTLHATEIYGNVVNDGGTLAPGRTLFGRTEIFGNYVQDAAATLAMDIGGTLATTTHDILVTSGFTHLGGLLELDLAGGFLPDASQNFFIVNSLTEITGAFANAANGARLATTDGLGSFQVNYGAQSPFGAFEVVLSDFQPSPDAVANAGDFDGDGDVDRDDLAAWAARFGSSNQSLASGGGSTNGSGFLDWQRNYQAPGAPAAIANVPEPSSWMLAGLAACVVATQLGARRR